MVATHLTFPTPPAPGQGRAKHSLALKTLATADDPFLSALLDLSATEVKRRSPLELVASVVLHAIVIATLIVVPMYFTDSLDLRAFRQTFLVAPLPPPPAPPPALVQKVAKAPSARPLRAAVLVAPVAVPKTVTIIREAPAVEAPAGVAGGTAGGIPGGVLGGILGGEGNAPAPPAAAVVEHAVTPKIVRLGGDVKPPRLISRVEPRYSPLARSARVEGDVLIDAVIDPQGNVVEAHVISGPGLLIPAALEAIGKWKYEPTMLNGVPVSLQMHVTVSFHLSSLP